MTLISSVMYVSPTATVNFTRNHAKGVGGAIYVHNARTTNVCINSQTKTLPCSIQVLQENQFEFCPSFVLHFDENKADIAGNIIYGDYTSACTPRNVSNVLNCNCNITLALDHYQYKNDSSDLSDFTSDPTRVCFCTILGVVNCFRVRQILKLYPGESFYLSLALVGYGMGTVPGSVVARSSNGKGTVNGRSILGSELEYSQEIKGTECQDLSYSIVSERHSEVIALTVDSVSSIRSLNQAMMVSSTVKGHNGFWPTREIFGTFSVLESFFHIPVFVEVDFLCCPVGFQLVRGRCVCHQILLDNNIETCFFFNGTGFILGPAPYWIGLLLMQIHPSLSTLIAPLIIANQETLTSLQSLSTLSVSTRDQEFSVAAVVKVSA